MADKISTFSVLFVKRNASQRGPNKSDTWNDTIEELSHDLTELNSQWNNNLVPLLDTVPDGSEGNVDNAIDAWTDGLDGSTLFVDADATNSLNTDYFNTTGDRPNTVLEQFEDVYDQINTVSDAITTSIEAAIPDANEIAILDTAELYTASNVEDALEEVMTAANLALEASSGSDVADTVTPTGTTQTLDLSLGHLQTLDLESATGNVTVTLSNPVAGHRYRIIVIQDSTTPRNLIWPATVKWPGGSAPTISVGANAEDVITLLYNGTNYYGTFEQNFS